ncbi:MAG TPA: DUF134 domain-containing protein [Candidatus Aciduliprofundum boonei]|uniref:UPF0251 protein ENL31_01755 n=1 Tax=Candidatus Aciduliprofundum boonei TaxID=379547 RepID=A0A7J3TA69_9ARCH|nr:DUF134 domain-containing protein [Candidatus Aciduliprofundum boonei]
MRGRGYCRRRGRGRYMRWIGFVPPINYFHPAGVFEPQQVIELTLEEIEAMRLVDLEHLTQEEAAMRMGVSRKTLWNDLKSGREKVIRAIINGYPIRITGGRFALHPEADLSKMDDTLGKIYSLLPGRNCGVCGYGSCIGFARALAQGRANPDECRFLDSGSRIEIMKILERR